MNARPTGLLLVLTSLAGWALFLGILSDRAELFVVSIPLFVAFLSAGRARPPSELQLAAAVSSTRLIEGDRLTLAVKLVSSSSAPWVEILCPVPPGMMLVAGPPRVVAPLRGGEPFECRFHLCARMRGEVGLGGVHVRTFDHSGLNVAEMRLGTDVEVHCYPALPRVRHLPRPRRTRASFGNYVARQLGPGLEPGEIRPFVRGDRVRQVNWPASLRRGELYVTQYHQEQNADVVLLLDSLAETGARPSSSLDASVRAAAALAAAYLARKDRVGFVDYGGFLRWIRPGSGRRHWESLLEAMLPAETVFTYVAKDLTFLPAPVLPPQALVIAISPFLDERFTRAVIDLAGRGYDLFLLAVSPIGLMRRVLPASDVTNLACRIWELERRARFSELRGKGLTLVEWDPDEPLERALASLGTRVSWPRAAL